MGPRIFHHKNAQYHTQTQPNTPIVLIFQLHPTPSRPGGHHPSIKSTFGDVRCHTLRTVSPKVSLLCAPEARNRIPYTHSHYSLSRCYFATHSTSTHCDGVPKLYVTVNPTSSCKWICACRQIESSAWPTCRPFVALCFASLRSCVYAIFMTPPPECPNV